MKISQRIFIGYFLVVALTGVFLLFSLQSELRPAMRQSMESTLVDTSNLLAELVDYDRVSQRINIDGFAFSMQQYMQRTLDATIWGLQKNKAELHIYITDAEGYVIYDSRGQDVGKDFSKWNDIYLTLQGKYGVRSTRSDPDDATSSTMYVAAPIMYADNIVGVLSVGRETLSVVPFIELSQQKMFQAALLLMGAALLVGWFFSKYLGSSAAKLADYARRASRGEKIKPPEIADTELSLLASEMESMREALEGKRYVEHYVHSLTHELKSPLTGMNAALELLSADMPLEDREHFIANIRRDTSRLQDIVDRLLQLAQLEQQQELVVKEPIGFAKIAREVAASAQVRMQDKNIVVKCDVANAESVMGDPFLVQQALTNLLDNAIDFSPKGGAISVSGAASDEAYILSVQDEGAGIPDYAKQKLFERFYSLPRPSTGQKSSGLGLSFVREIMTLHKGSVYIKNAEKGCVAALYFPL